MAKRLYTSIYDVESCESNVILENSTSALEQCLDGAKSNMISSDDIPNKQGVFRRNLIIIVFSILIFLLLVFILFTGKSYYNNIRTGGNTSQESIVGFITCLSDEDDSSMFSYIPSEIRNSGFLIDTAGLSDLQKIDEIFHIEFTAITITELVSLSDLDNVTADIKAKYNVELRADEAVAARVSAKYEYKDGLDVKSDVFSADLVSICLHGKWYVCPGVSIPDGIFQMEPDNLNMESEDVIVGENIPLDISSVDTLNYIAPVEKELIEIEPYRNALKDLKSGKVTIDDKEYVFPCSYLDMLDVIRLCYDNDVTSLDSLTAKTSIKPNYILNNLPAVFTNLNYNMADLYVSIGNRTKDNIYVDAGDVTMFSIGIPKSPYSYQIYDYPMVVLPGNVTFGTSLSDVELVYGELKLCEDKSNVIVYSDTAVCYAIQLDNSHNFLYLQFEDFKLVSVQWYYYDFNAYNS